MTHGLTLLVWVYLAPASTTSARPPAPAAASVTAAPGRNQPAPRPLQGVPTPGAATPPSRSPAAALSTPPAKPTLSTASPSSASPPTAGASATTTVPSSEGTVTRYSFTGLDIEGELRTPALLSFLARVGGEFETTGLAHRSYLPELAETRAAEALE